MTLNAGGNITNFQDATIDSDGNFAATATNVFLNQGQINIAGSATITARTFQNVMAGAENISRVWLGLASSGSTIDEHNYSLFSDPGVPNGSTSQWYYTGHGGYSGSWFDDRESTVYGYFYRKEAFAGIADPQAAFGNTLKPQIAATNLTVNGFDSGKNVGGLLTATGTLAINGSGGGSTFVNDAMVLGVQKWNYQATWWYEYTVGSYDWWNPTGDDHITNRLTTIAFAQDYFSIGAGLRAGNLSVTNVGTLTLLGSANPAGTNATTATGGSMESLGAAADVSGPGATTSAMAVAVTGASVANGSGARLFGRAGAGGGPTDSSSARDTANSVTPDKAQLTSGTGLRGTQNADTANIGTADTFGANIEGAQLGGSRTFGAMSASALANALKNASVSLNGLTLKLPSNPNGLFVPNADPKSKFLVGVNSTFGIDPSSAVGSDELFKILGSSGRAPRFDDNPEHLLKRLGDATYETYLVRQQLVQQLGAKLLNGQKNEADQMRTLMANAASEASRLGLQIGQAPTPAQLAALGKDIVWMVEQVVGGQRVLVPQVYLSAKTKSLFDPTNSTVAGDNVAMDVGSLTNTGGSISGSDSLSIKAKGDITNLSGSISGGDVKLDAGGSIRNETLVQGNENSTVVSKTAGITSTGTMDLSAGKDIKIIGADVKSGGDASISAGGEIVVDTVQKKTTTRTSTGSSGFIGSSSSTTTTTDVKNQGSNLDFGGNLKLKSGGDTTLAGANVNVGGNLDTDVGGNLNVVARQDQHTVDTTEKTSGFGVGGGLYGSQEKTKNDFTGTNFGSTINVGGDANIKAAKTLTLEGSDLKVAGGGSISATDVKVLDGKDEHRVTETTKTTTVGVFTDSSADAGAEAMARAGGKSASASTKEGSGTESGHNRLSAEASASASAEGSGGATIGVRTNTTTTNTYDSTSRASNISFGGNLKIEAKNDLAVRGSNIEAGGDVDLKAKNMQFLAGQDVHTSTTTSSTTTAGLNFEGKGNADASAGAAVGPTGGGAEAGANAFGEVSAGYKVEVNNSTSSEGSTTARVSTIKSGGNLTRTADNKITDVGTSIDVGGDLNQSAKTIESLAAKNTSYSSEDSTTHTAKVGLYADAKASASAEAGAGLGTGAKAEANAEASATAGFKASYDYNSSSSSSSSSEAVVSNIKVGGKMNSKSTEKTTFEGTNIETAGDANIEAKSLEFKAAQNTSTSSSTEKNASAEMKLGVGAGASGGTDGGGGGVGLQGSLAASGGKSTSNESSSEAVTGSINSGGKLKITTKEDMRFEGTNLSSEGDTKLKAGGNVTFDAARNTSESSSDSFHAGGELSANTYGGTKAVSGGLEGGFSKEKSQSSEAVTGSINSGGKLKIEAGGSASFEGTDLAAKGDATIDAKRDVTFKQATSTSSSSSTEFSASLEVGGESNKGEGSSSKSFAASAEGGYSTESEKTAKTSNISTGGKLNIKSGNDVTLQGTNIDAGGDANISAKGNLNLTAKEESSSSFGVSGGLEVGGGTSTEKGEKTTSKSMGANLSLEGQKDVTREGGTIKSGGNVNLSSGKNTTLVGTQVESAGDINVAAGGTVTQKKAESSSVGGAIGLSLEHESEKKAPAAGGTTSATNTPKPSTPETKAGETKAGETGAGEKKDEGPKTGGGVTDLGFNASASSQGTSLKSGSGKVNIQQNVKQPATTTTAPAKSTKSGSSVAPKAPAAPPPTK
jgi:adhesin HecA-like repeat protein